MEKYMLITIHQKHLFYNFFSNEISRSAI